MDKFPFKLTAVCLAASLLTGCGSMRSYQSELKGTVDAASRGQVDVALAQLESNNTGEDKDLLYFLEKGKLLTLKNDLPQSVEAWQKADEKVRIWEDAVKTDPYKLMGDISSYIVNDKSRRYDGYDYEKVMLNTFLTVNQAASGRWEDARVEIKKTHEREALIAEFRAKETEKVEESAKSRNVKTSFKDLKGYPVETLDDAEVVGLKNSYQSAFSHYLAGFVYEALGEPSLAAPGYRKAIELRPNVKLLEDGLSDVDNRGRRIKPNQTDVLFVVETGTAPARVSQTIPFPVWWKGAFLVTPISFPVIRPDRNVFLPSSLSVSGRSLPVASVTSIDAMSRRALRDDMPGIIVRSAVRAAAKGVAQKEIGDRAGPLGGLIATVAAVATESADERTWRTLPSQIAIARDTLPAGHHTISIATPQGEKRVEVDLAGKHAIVPIRLMGDRVYLVQPSVPALPSATQMAVAESATVPASEPAKPVKAKGKKAKNKGTES
ncbi:hypothetical protein ABWL39_06340 [Chitinivorax sp. PXF-14]|uniref:COG3014 family protein n=1 Tax=Chitinivorax sp. PXF-14 TaxID=3230488 RepID=UPI003467723E